MTEARRDITGVFLLATTAEWITTLGLVFGGCCSNAWALELATAQNPHAGSLITFAQFLLVSVYGLSKHLSILSMSEAVSRRIVDDVLKVRARRPHVGPLYIALEGSPQEATTFAKLLLSDLKCAIPRLRVSLLNGSQNTRDLSESNDGVVSPPQAGEPRDSVVLVCGQDLASSKLRNRWDYTISLEKIPRGDIPPVTANSSLVVDVTSITHPIVLHQPGHLLPSNVLQWLSLVRLAPRAIPISRWAVQVALFLLTSLMNNAAFAYDVPMAVHIIFRSGGLVVNMLIGYLIGGRRYIVTQVISVVLVTLGVACTTLSAARPAEATQVAAGGGSYSVGIMLLTLALIMSGLMGLAQDRAYEQYGRGHWQEAMFYLHFLAMPGFAFVWRGLAAQVRIVNASPRIKNIGIPSFYLPLLLNIVTQLVCISGVHRLTSRVNSLTVTLVLVVRKAVSLGISVVLLKNGRGAGVWLWGGAALVLLGTVGYAIGGSYREQEKGKNE